MEGAAAKVTTWPLLFPFPLTAAAFDALPLSLATTSELRRFSEDEDDLRIDSRAREGSEPAMDSLLQ